MLFDGFTKGNFEFLSVPKEIKGDDANFNRTHVPYENLSQKYLLQNEASSAKQYYEIYDARLKALRPRIEQVVIKNWGNVFPIKRLHELDVGSEPCVIIGTLFKRQSLKPSILKELSEEAQIAPQPLSERFISSDDNLVLEDEVQRIQLQGKICVDELITGVICAVKGVESVSGSFCVEDILFPGLPMDICREPEEKIADAFLLVVCGLELGSDTSGALLRTRLLLDTVAGHVGSTATAEAVARVCRVLVAGDSGSSQDVPLPQKVRQAAQLDELLRDLSSSCPVDVMAGALDTANHVLPQQPLHRCLLPKSRSSGSVFSAPNPYEFGLGGRVVAATAGQNVRDVLRCAENSDEKSAENAAIWVLKKLLQWGHLAPSAPDTLPCHPFRDFDPFVLDTCPDILIAANQDSYASEIVQGPTKRHLLLSLPRFSRSGIAAIVNLKSLSTTPLRLQ